MVPAVTPDPAVKRPSPYTGRVLRALTMATLGGTILVSAAAIAVRLRPTRPPRVQRQVHSWMCRALRIKVKTMGVPATGPVLYICNHLSWTDIVVLGSRVLGSFVAKSELKRWPVLGPLADLQRTIYVRREDRHRADEQKNEIAARLLAGENVILFPEGTSGEGNCVLPFKTSLFGIADTPGLEHLIIQPITLSYTHLNGLPLLRSQRSKVSWIGDMDFGPHAMGVLGLGYLQALIQFHQPVTRDGFTNRKRLGRHCEEVIAEGLYKANAGRV